MNDVEIGRFDLFIDKTGERLHIHERSDDGETRCVTQLNADMAAVWAVSFWDAKKKMESEA